MAIRNGSVNLTMTVIKSDSTPAINRMLVENDIDMAAASTATVAVRFKTYFDNNRLTIRVYLI